MDEKTLNNLTQLEQLFHHTCQVCDPLDYVIRQRNLVYTLTNFLLLPLMEHREEEKKRKEEEKLSCCKETEISSDLESV